MNLFSTFDEMKIGIISDIHSNLEALISVFEELEKLEVSEIYCLGDLVGYGPNPNECIELIKKKCTMILAGNHDYAVAGREDVEQFNSYAKLAVEWTQTVISEANLEFLAGLEPTGSRHHCLFVHATPSDPLIWDYIFDLADADYNFKFFEDPVCFIGHSHIPMVISKLNKKSQYVRGNYIQLNKDSQYLINVGSVGQPRDRNPQSSFGVLDISEQAFTFHRAAYSIEKTQEKMTMAKLPEYLITRLKIGY